MKPSEYLKYAAAAALIIFVITTSWKQMAATVEQVGLSTTQIILFVACVTIAVCALFAFIFLAIGAWHDADGAFIAVVQSTFIAGSGFVTQMAAARKSSDDDTEKAEEMAEESLKDD